MYFSRSWDLSTELIQSFIDTMEAAHLGKSLILEVDHFVDDLDNYFVLEIQNSVTLTFSSNLSNLHEVC